MLIFAGHGNWSDLHRHTYVVTLSSPWETTLSGNTTRWGVAWSHHSSIPPLLSPNPKKVTTTYSFTAQSNSSQDIVSRLQANLAQLHVRVVVCPGDSNDTEFCAWVTASENTWSHSRRKRRKEGLERAGKKLCTGHESEQLLKNESENLEGKNSESERLSTVEMAGCSETKLSRVCLFHCLLSVEKCETGISVDFTWIFGSHKDSLNQFCCFVAKSISNSVKDSNGWDFFPYFRIFAQSPCYWSMSHYFIFQIWFLQIFISILPQVYYFSNCKKLSFFWPQG